METAGDMYNSGRMVYCIFMCHLSLEKASKGLLVKRTGEYPSRSHSLMFMGLQMEEDAHNFMSMLNRMSVPTRYPDDLRKLFKEYTKDRTQEILDKTKKVQVWIKRR